MTRTFTIKLGKSPDEMTFDECMAHIKRVLFWDYVDGEWCDVEILNDIRWEELAGYINGAHEREILAAKAETKEVEAENARLRDLASEMYSRIIEDTDYCGHCPRLRECNHGCPEFERLLHEQGVWV